MKRRFLNTSLLASMSFALLVGMTSCTALQDSLSSEQKKDQAIDIGTVTAESTTYYYNGKSGESVKNDEAHLSLKLGQIADATNAIVSYTLSYKLNDITRSATGSGKGTLSASKSQYYVDLSPATTLIDGTGDVASDDISMAITVAGLTNVSGNDYNGYTMAKFNKTITFVPLYSSDEIIFSTRTTAAGATFAIPLNGKITAVDNVVTATATTGTLPATTFTANVSNDGTQILLTSSANLTNTDCTADIALTGIKPIGSKESYSYTFTGVTFKPLSVVVDGVLDEEAWQTATTSTASYANPENYNLSKVYVTNDDVNLYIALEGNLSFGSDDRIIVMIDNTSSSDSGKGSSDSDYNSYYGPATNTLFTSVDFYLCHILATAELQDYKWISASGRTDVKTSAKTASETIIEYQIPLSSITDAKKGSVLKLFVSTGTYEYIDATKENTVTLNDYIPDGAAIVSGNGQIVTLNLGGAMSYTIQ